MILALLTKPTGRGGLRCWNGFLFDTDFQADAELFMAMIYHQNYFLLDPDKLDRNESGNWVYQGLWVSCTQVKPRGVSAGFYIRE